jgi:hypothetical protein
MAQKAAHRTQLYKYKGNKCANCGLSVEEMFARFGTVNRMFQFNHVDPKQKDPSYDNLIQRQLSGEQLDEVDKCVLLCDECHGILHAQNINAQLNIKVRVRGKEAEQTLNGQVIIDKVARQGTFLTNERVLVCPYWAFVGSKKPKMHFGKELEADALVNYLRKLSRDGSIAVRSYTHCHSAG